jgi:hypothetical protein
MNANRVFTIAVAVCGLLMLDCASALAQSPIWNINAAVYPTSLAPSGKGVVEATITNLGDADANDARTSPIVIHDQLPAGLTVTGMTLEVGFQTGGYGVYGSCNTTSVTCKYNGVIPPYGHVYMAIEVSVAEQASSGVNQIGVTGGDALPVSSESSVHVGGETVRFGIESFSMVPENEDGSPDMQAGSHPFQLTTTLAFNKNAAGKSISYGKDLHFQLPPGMIGNPQVVAQCTSDQFSAFKRETGINECPADTAIGVATVLEREGVEYTVPLFNLTPLPGEPARFGFEVAQVPVVLDTAVRTGGDYGVTVSVDNISQEIPVIGSQVTFWGAPGDPRHDNARGSFCLLNGNNPYYELPGKCVEQEQDQAPLLTMPVSCEEGFRATVQADSWLEPENHTPSAEYTLAGDQGDPLLFGGCEKLDFQPSIQVAPDGHAGSTPTGLTVDLHVPQEISLNPTGLAEADVRNTTVTLPAGIQLSPSGADGLQSCSNPQIGFTGVNPITNGYEFTDAPAACPDASKIATVAIKTPLLPNPLEGAVYLAAPQNFAGALENPFGSLVAMYIVAEDPVSGTLVKLPGRVSTDASTGQIVATFDNTPQLPFEQLELHFFGGARAPLSTPAGCGSYTVAASIAPWSSAEAANSSSSFDIESGPNGASCSNPQPFTPGFQAGSTNLQAGGFTPFALTMTRPDADQTLSRVEMQMPPGLLGTLSDVALCPEPQAAQGTCGPESLIGETVVSAGLGSEPFTVTGGKVYITTGYKGAPYGLSIVNPAAAGPFVLDEGRPVVVRASIDVDPHTAALRIVSDPLPTILDGIPLQIQHVNVNINRPGFTFNPTNCNKAAIGGTLSSSEGASAAVSTPFQVTNCASLAFKPKLAVFTSGKTSKANGASLTVKLTYPKAPQGTEANIAKVKVDLPKQLPSRLTTLQKACLAKVFEANPANCPAESVVGHAKAITPVLPVPLEGPAYFVSHGGEAFPSLVVVLQGYGATVDLVGTTFISKQGITSSTFKTVPDVPVGSFELNLPEGKYSALAANGNLCTSKLAMPTAFVGQNGAEIHESTPVGVTGCAKAKPMTRARKLAKALKACKQEPKAKRAACQEQAGKQYGQVKKRSKQK